MLYNYFWVIPRRLSFKYLPMKMEQTECSETSEFKTQDAGELPKSNYTTKKTHYLSRGSVDIKLAGYILCDHPWCMHRVTNNFGRGGSRTS